MKRRFVLALAGASTALLLHGCASHNIDSYANQQPTLDLQQYFNGTLDGWGMFQDRSGKVVKRFTVLMQCRWQGDVGTFEEDFVYSDGTRQRRVWTLRKTGANSFTGTADDVIGTAVGTGAGNSLHWNYVLALPVDGKVYNMHMDDWMFLIDERVMLNRTTMSKFGVELGSVTLSFTKRP